jgi:hypothetical protein
MCLSIRGSDVATRIYIAQRCQSRSGVSIRNLILFCIHRFGYRSKSSINVPNKDLTTKTTRGDNVALQYRGPKKTVKTKTTKKLKVPQKSTSMDYILLGSSKTNHIIRMLAESPSTGTLREAIPHL